MLIENFIPISINKFVAKQRKMNSDTDVEELKKNLNHFRALKLKGEKCDCGNPIWIIGSAIAGKICFTCLTGETDTSEDYEIK